MAEAFYTGLESLNLPRVSILLRQRNSVDIVQGLSSAAPVIYTPPIRLPSQYSLSGEVRLPPLYSANGEFLCVARGGGENLCQVLYAETGDIVCSIAVSDPLLVRRCIQTTH